MNRNPERKKKTFVENFWRHFLRPKCTFVCVCSMYVWIVEGWEQDIVSQTLKASSKHTYVQCFKSSLSKTYFGPTKIALKMYSFRDTAISFFFFCVSNLSWIVPKRVLPLFGAQKRLFVVNFPCDSSSSSRAHKVS